MLIATKINTHFQDLNLNERNILFSLLENKGDYCYLTIDEFAKKNTVSKSFVMRMCKKLGYSGFSEFKYQLKVEAETAEIQQSTESLIETAKNDISETLQLVDVALLNRISQLIKQAPHIYTYGSGYGQRTILEDFRRGIISSQRAVTALPTSVELRLNSSIMQENDVLFIVSMSGHVDSILNNLTRLKDKGVHVISITEFSTNPLASIASINLYLKTTPTVNPLYPERHYVSYTSLCFLLDLIVRNYLLSNN